MVKNLEKINSIKRDAVRQIAERACDYPIVSEVIIFGSSVRDDCTEESDVDICVKLNGSIESLELYEYKRVFGKILNYNYDFLVYDYVEESFRENQIDIGVTVYEQ